MSLEQPAATGRSVRSCRRAARSGGQAKLLRNLGAALFCLATTHGAAGEPAKITIAGDAPLNGIFDPSVEFAPGAAVGWLSYSAVFGGLSPFGPNVETHLARTDDGGASWSFVTAVNSSTATAIDIPGKGLVSGVWNYEVSSLVHDPGDPGAAWKLFAHRVFRRDQDDFTDEQNEPAYSWIVLRTAPDPSGPWSAERALLSSGPLPPAPFGDVEVAVNALDASLSDLLVYSEPGAFERGGTLYLSLTGLKATGPDRIILLASDDHGGSWRYVGTPLSAADATSLGYLSFDGSAIVADRGRVFLLVTPESPGLLHDGTLVFEFGSLASATLVSAQGAPLPRRWLPPQPGIPAERRGGQADYHEGGSGGILQPAIHVEDAPEIFQFSATGETPSDGTPAPAAGFGSRALLAMALALAAAARLRV